MRYGLIAKLLALLFATQASAAEGWKAVDGDTIRTPTGEVVRLPHIDSPETGARCRCESECRMGEAAKGYTRAQLELARVVELRPYSRSKDKYGRTLAFVLTDGQDLGERLIAAGLARKWEGRRRSWCGTD